MIWQQWIIAGWFLMHLMFQVAAVGKTRTIITPAQASWSVGVHLLLILVISHHSLIPRV